MYLILVILHLLGAVIWFGGILFIALVLVPVSRAFGDTGNALVRAVGRRFLWVAWPAIALAVATGIVLGFNRGFLEALFTGSLFDFPQGGLFTLKVLLVLASLVLEALHDWVVGPRGGRLERAALATNPPDPALLAKAQAMRRATARIASVNGGVVLAIVIIGVWLSRG
ncbi:MAG: CopD family protein [Dehalococcoidia bacterium]